MKLKPLQYIHKYNIWPTVKKDEKQQEPWKQMICMYTETVAMKVSEVLEGFVKMIIGISLSN